MAAALASTAIMTSDIVIIASLGVGFTVANSFIAINEITGILATVANKTGLSNRVREIEEQLELDTLGKGRGV